MKNQPGDSESPTGSVGPPQESVGNNTTWWVRKLGHVSESLLERWLELFCCGEEWEELVGGEKVGGVFAAFGELVGVGEWDFSEMDVVV